MFFTKQQVTGGELLALLWIVGIFLTRPFRQMPWFFTFAFDSWTSLKRLEEFFSIKNNKTDEDGREPAAMTRDEAFALQVRGLNLRIGARDILNKIDKPIINATKLQNFAVPFYPRHDFLWH